MPRSLIYALWIAALCSGAPARAQDAPADPSADVPRVDALRSPDGSYTLTLYPPFSWIGAEVEVSGTDGVDLGAAGEGEPVSVSGWTGKKGPLDITLRVATPRNVGVTWEFLVDPTSVPERPPTLKRAEGKPKHRGHG